MTIINVSNIFAEVEWKEIKNIHLTIYPPNARVHVSAPIGMILSRYVFAGCLAILTKNLGYTLIYPRHFRNQE